MLNKTFEPFTAYVPGASAVVGNDINVFIATHIIAMVAIFVSIFSSSAVIIQSIRGRRYNNLHARYPIYLSIADLVFACTHIIDHFVVFTNRRYPSSTVCRVLGSLVILGWGYQMTINAALAAQCWGRIVMKWQLALGKWEWKLHALVLSTVFTLMIVGLSIDALGPGPYYLIFRNDWETANGAGAGMWILTAFVLLPTIVLTVGVTSFFIHRAVKQATLDVKKYTVAESRARQADIRMLNFAIIACIQYIPTIIMITLMLFGDDSSVPNKVGYICALITVNSGGTMNFIVWMWNEKARARLRRFRANEGSTSALASARGSQWNTELKTHPEVQTFGGTVSKAFGRTFSKTGLLAAGKSSVKVAGSKNDLGNQSTPEIQEVNYC